MTNFDTTDLSAINGDWATSNPEAPVISNIESTSVATKSTADIKADWDLPILEDTHVATGQVEDADGLVISKLHIRGLWGVPDDK